MIDLWFPTAIYLRDNLITEDENNILKEYCLDIQSKIPSGGLDWVGGTYTTHGSYECSKDQKVSSMIKMVSTHVHKFAHLHGCVGEYNNYSTWMNISTTNSGQEFHSHPNSIISAVYYVSAPEGSGKILFEDPREPDMMPLKNLKNRNEISCTRTPYEAKEGRLVIFRSYLRHMVEPGNNKEPRISFALNFN